MSIITSVAKIGEVVATWLDPERREKAVLRAAIASAEQLLMILRRQGRYKFFTEQKLKEHEEHFQKRFDAWRDGEG